MPRNKKDLTLKGAIEMPLNFRERQSVIKELANQHVNGTAQRQRDGSFDMILTVITMS